MSIGIALSPKGQQLSWMLWLLVAFVGVRALLLRVSVSKEQDADRVAVEGELNEGDYARALLAMHEAGLMPATLTKGSNHPSLYDRLTSAGALPDFPRPRPPSRAAAFWAGFVSVPLMLALAAGLETS
ncbi:MAG: hypothetical protein JW940_14195 [Polyangiaceae bacterium]|nr:hypothetical protein [Polyangiaceae bacterium]